MKDLKKNIQKNNMKKLVLSAVLGMFCYCTNNAMEEEEEEEEEEEIINIGKVKNAIINIQIDICNAKVEILPYEKKIYSTIAEGGKVIKKKVLEFITNLYTTDEQNQEGFKDNINKIEQYFHLEELEPTDECNKENLTEIFWTVPEAEEEIEEGIEGDEKNKIKEYFMMIIQAENNLSTVFKSYYDAIKTKHEDTEYEGILKIIMKDCCGEETKSNPVTNLMVNLYKWWGEKNKGEKNEEVKKYIIIIISRRITLSNNIEKRAKDFIFFLKQKIGIEEKKEEEKKDSPKGSKPAEEEKKNSQKGGEPAEEEGCSCCNDCCGKE